MDPVGVSDSESPAVVKMSRVLDAGCEGEADAVGKVCRMKSIISRRGVKMDESSCSISSLVGDELHSGDARGRSCLLEERVSRNNPHQMNRETNADALEGTPSKRLVG